MASKRSKDHADKKGQTKAKKGKKGRGKASEVRGKAPGGGAFGAREKSPADKGAVQKGSVDEAGAKRADVKGATDTGAETGKPKTRGTSAPKPGTPASLLAPPRRRATEGARGEARSGFASSGGAAAADAFTAEEDGAIPLYVVQTNDYQEWLESAPDHFKSWLMRSGFKPTAGKSAVLPGDGGVGAAVVVVANLGCLWDYAELPCALPEGVYDAEPELAPAVADALCLGWALGAYRFQRYRSKKETRPRLLWPERADRKHVLALAEAIYLTRDLVTTPASDMGPSELADEAERLGKVHGAQVSLTVGDDLLGANYPMIHAVGRASSRAPRLIDLRWGKETAPLVTLVGKGVCFDTGGLDLKPAQYMLLMKKDMGGGALVLGLAHAVMTLGLPVRLRVLIPAVENSVSGNAMRPLDVLATRKGITVEVGDTDAEGRLVLADALTEALVEKPALLIDAATLTGAARVALGAGVPAVFANKDTTWAQLERASADCHDPLWRLPLHDAYRAKLDSRVADLSSVGDNLGGAITAALFLREFASKEADWVHVDTMGYNVDAQPGRPRGGEALALRALLLLLERRFGADALAAR